MWQSNRQKGRGGWPGKTLLQGDCIWSIGHSWYEEELGQLQHPAAPEYAHPENDGSHFCRHSYCQRPPENRKGMMHLRVSYKITPAFATPLKFCIEKCQLWRNRRETYSAYGWARRSCECILEFRAFVTWWFSQYYHVFISLFICSSGECDLRREKNSKVIS